jgi:hypothetical protein
MATTVLSVYNKALRLIRESSLTSLSEVRESRYLLDEAWDEVLKEMVEAGFWHFAMRDVKITYDPDVTPNFGYRYCFNMPADWVKTYMVAVDERLNIPYEHWMEQANALWAEVTPLYLRYVSNSSSGYGYDLDRWTAGFVKAFSSRLALEIAPKASGSSDSLIERVKAQHEEDMAKALSFEAMRQPPRRLPQGEWNKSRGGNNWHHGKNYRYG